MPETLLRPCHVPYQIQLDSTFAVKCTVAVSNTVTNVAVPNKTIKWIHERYGV